ncbi:Peptidase S1 domain-containing protein [Sergentomyia squamirostris]
MRKLFGIAILAYLSLAPLVAANEGTWSWGGSDKDSRKDETVKIDQVELLMGEEKSPIRRSSNVDNDTLVDEIVDSILTSSRQGRNIDGFDEVYSDPSVKEAIQNGDDVEARNIIKDKLCSLGLMQCDFEDTEGKRPYLHPEELIYAQPVAIRPVGRPQPSVPYKYRPGGPPPRGPPYGPAKPMPPPRKVGYAPSGKPPGYGPPGGKPYFSGPGPIYSSPPSGTGGSQLIYSPKPPGPVYEGGDSLGPYEFESPANSFQHSEKIHYEHNIQDGSPFGHKDKPTIVLNGAGGSAVGAASNNLQQHVHHHYHHADGGIGEKIAIPVPVPVPVPSTNAIVGNEYSHSPQLTSSSSGGFQPVNGGFSGGLGGLGGQYSDIRPVNENLQNPGPASFGSSNSVYGSSGSYGSGSGSLGSANFGSLNGQDYYKKQFANNGGLQSNYAQSQQSNYAQSQQYLTQASQYPGYNTARQENIDCVCVPFDQCPAAEVIGRKDDLILPLDPRSLPKDIEALSDEAVITDGNGTMTVVRVPKKAEDDTKPEDIVEEVEETTEEVKKISKRDVSDKSVEGDNKANIEPRLLGFNGANGLKKKVEPTFGVSFGLPYPTHGYPLNPYGPYPANNPYFGSISPNGLNLGLVNVNPLVSLQVTKDEYGEKVLKPLVNVHVTPNENLLHKVGHFFNSKKHGIKQAIHSQHYHQHTHYPSPPEIYHPHHHYPSGPYYDSPPPNYSHGPSYYGHSGGGYGFPSGPPSGPSGPSGYFRDSGPDLDYNPFLFDSRSANGSAPQQQQKLSQYHYQNIYPQNQNNFQGPDTREYRNEYANEYNYQSLTRPIQAQAPGDARGSKSVTFPTSRRRRSVEEEEQDETIVERSVNAEKRQAFYRPPQQQLLQQQCGPRSVCCRRPLRPQTPSRGPLGQCGARNAQGINGRIKNPVYVDGDSEFGEYPWQAAILKKDPKESVYVCGGTLIDHQHILTAAHCVKTYNGFDLRVRLGEWDVNHDVEFYPYIERDVIAVQVHPEYYAGTLDNDLAVLRLNHPVDFTQTPHISPACLPDRYSDFTGARCWTTGWGKDAFGDFGKYQNILKEVDVPVIGDLQCQQQLRNTRLGYNYRLHPGFLCAGGEEGKDACKGDGGGPLVCERSGVWQLAGIVSWGIGCGQVNVPGVYVKVSYYLDWINQVTRRF